MEARGSLKTGEPVDVRAEGAVFKQLGDRGVWRKGDVTVAVCKLGTALAGPGDRGEEARVLPFVKAAGRRGRLFGDAVGRWSDSAAADWGVKGPRTMLWLGNAIAEQATTPTARHYLWRQVLRLSAGDNGVDDHSFLNEVVETAT